MKEATTWKDVRADLQKSVAYIVGNSGRRAFDAVVVEIRKAGQPWEQTPRTVVLRTSGTLHMERDLARVRTLCRRLRRHGVRFNTGLGDCCNVGVCGTIFAHI